MTSCEAFRDAVAELAVGVATAATGDRLLAHARECAACQALLDETTVVADHLLHLAPGSEPPAGFEVRALAGMASNPPTRRARSMPAAVSVAAAAVLVVLCLVAGLAIGRATAPTASRARAGALVSAGGTDVGTVELSRTSGGARIVLTMPEPATWPGTWTCELESSSGRWVGVGSWQADDVRGGVWATGVDPGLATSARMRIVDATGRVVVTAALS